MSTTPETPDTLEQIVEHARDIVALAGTASDERVSQALLLKDTQEKLDKALERIRELEEEPEPEPPSLDPFALPCVGMAYGGNADPTPVEKRLGFVVDSRRTYHGASAAELTDAENRIEENIEAGRRISSLSFKLPFSWADMASGRGDSWVKARRERLAAKIAGSGHGIRIALHHEPEGDKPSGVAESVGRDQWKALQLRHAPAFDIAGIQFVVIVQGYPQLRTDSSLHATWELSKAIPIGPGIKGVGYDLYQYRGRTNPTTGKVDGWTNFTKYLAQLKAFHDGHPGLAWGLSETGETEAAEVEKPGTLPSLARALFAAGGTWFEYFNSNLNSTAKWQMDPGSAREKAFADLLATT